MHRSSASADLPGIAYLAVLLRQNCFFIAIFPAELGGTTSRVSGTAQCTSVQQVQRRRPQPAAETGRSCWGRGQQDTSTAQGAKWMLGAATRRNFSYGSASAGPFFAVCAPQNGAYNKAPPLRLWSGGALFVRVYSRKAVCGIGDWDISARAFWLSLSGGAKQGDTGL